MDHQQFSGRHVIVTGGTGGLGTAVIKKLVEAGAHCSVPCYDEQELSGFPYADDDHITLQSGVDLTDADQSEAFFRSANKQNPVWASLHIAGGFGMGKIEKMHSEDLQKMLHINVLTCFNSCKYAIENFRSQGNGGRIVNVAARPAEFPRQGSGLSTYTTSKAGVAAMTQSLAQEVHKENILINAVSPSIIDTPANREGMPDADHAKWPKPEEIAETILFLASPDNTLTHGAVLPVYGKV